MYGLPANFDASFLLGRTLEMLCFNANQVYLHFGEQVSIVLEGSFSIQRAAIGKMETFHVSAKQSELMILIEQRVIKATGFPDGTLELRFQNGAIIRCLDDSSEYECYTIVHGENRYIV